MILKIVIVLSACANLTMGQAYKRAEELQKQFPDAKVTVRVDKKCLKGE